MTKASQSFGTAPVKYKQTIHNIQRLIWVYFLLIIFEGSLRKWVVPQLSTPLLIIRDPVVIGAYLIALRARLFPKDIFTKSIIYLAFISFLAGLATVVTSDSTLVVALFGLRTNFLHLPLIFLIPKVFSLDDVKKLGKWVLLLSLPMAVLMICQFYSSPDAFINRVAGTGKGEQITAAFGRIRPPGTFSFISGPIYYFPLVTSFLLYGLLQSKIYFNWLLSAAGLGLALALAVSGSRSLFGTVAVVLISLLAVLVIRPSIAGKSYRLLLIAGLIGLSIPFVPAFNEGTEVLNARVESSGTFSEGDGNIFIRFFNSFLEPFNNTDQIPLLGYGLGMGTNAGSALLTGKVTYLLAEGEWPRVIMESGLILGLLYLLLRIAIICWMGGLCIKSASTGNILPLLLFGSCALLILNGQFGQPTTLGFAVIGGGLCLASRQVESPVQALPAIR